LRLLDEAFDIIGESSGNPVSSDLCRLKGDLLLLQSPGDQAESESWFRKSLEIAQERKAKMLELRAAICLNRLWREQGKGKQGRELLKDVYETFTEGFTTADLTESKALLEDLS
jgi:predicted ATPase